MEECPQLYQHHRIKSGEEEADSASRRVIFALLHVPLRLLVQRDEKSRVRPPRGEKEGYPLGISKNDSGAGHLKGDARREVPGFSSYSLGGVVN